MSKQRRPAQELCLSPRLQPTSTIHGVPATSSIAISRAGPSLSRINPCRNFSTRMSNCAIDPKLQAILAPFCKLHHNHGTGQGVIALKNNPAYRVLLEQGLAKIPKPLWIKAELEEVYTHYFDEYCAGKKVELRQKQLMYEFFAAWLWSIKSFIDGEATKRGGKGAIDGKAQSAR